MDNPAGRLLGITLSTGWRVAEKIPRQPGSTGGHFSAGYIVKSTEGKTAFLKALDFSKAFSSDDPARALQALTEAFNFERDLLIRCRDKRLDRVVVALEDGKITVDRENPTGVVQYIIFELAAGDVRSHLKLQQEFDLAWILRSLHHLATGLKQLHGEGIAHQDIKPSNALVIGPHTKIGDLGRAASKSLSAPHDNLKVAGDFSYAPPELIYGHIPSDWNQRRFGCDLYLLGSMAVFFFTGVSMTSLLLAEMHPSQHWKKWQGTFHEILPYLRDAFGRAMEQVGHQVPVGPREELMVIIRQLCEPDPNLRGHPLNRSGMANPYSLERYISVFDALARKAEFKLFRREK
jgi:eukaryotic-like serine/threonine-protein kinase